MKDIKFRGKSVETDEWVYGSLINNMFFKANTNEPICYIVDIKQFEEYSSFEDVEYLAVEVKSETVGMCSPVKNRNTKEIFSGDIIKCEIPVEIVDNGCHSIDGETVFVEVLFDDGAFMARGKTVNYPWILNGDSTYLSWLFNINAYDKYKINAEVVGNVYENPELINQ